MSGEEGFYIMAYVKVWHLKRLPDSVSAFDASESKLLQQLWCGEEESFGKHEEREVYNVPGVLRYLSTIELKCHVFGKTTCTCSLLMPCRPAAAFDLGLWQSLRGGGRLSSSAWPKSQPASVNSWLMLDATHSLISSRLCFRVKSANFPALSHLHPH